MPIDDHITLRETIESLAPPWLKAYWGQRFKYNVGTMMDTLWGTADQGATARMPGYGTLEALSALGRDRQILRGRNETDDAYILRLQQAVDTWHLAGNPDRLLKQLFAYFSPFNPVIRYVTAGFDRSYGNLIPVNTYATIGFEDGVAYSYRSGHDYNWNWDGQPNDHRFWIILYIIGPIIQGQQWGGFDWGDGTTWGSSATADIILDVKAIIKKWKCAGTKCDNIIVVNSSESLTFGAPTLPPGPPMPDGNWDVPANRYANALYWGSVL
jgi:hypothetical protein